MSWEKCMKEYTEPLGGTLTSSQVDTDQILLTYYVEGHPILREGIWQVPILQQHHAIAIWGACTNERPLAILPVGIGHSRTLPYCHTVAKVPRRRNWLHHQMGQGKTIGHYHGEECSKFHLEKASFAALESPGSSSLTMESNSTIMHSKIFANN